MSAKCEKFGLRVGCLKSIVGHGAVNVKLKSCFPNVSIQDTHTKYKKYTGKAEGKRQFLSSRAAGP